MDLRDNEDSIKFLVVAIIERAFDDLHDLFITMQPKQEFLLQTNSLEGMKHEVEKIVEFLSVDGGAEILAEYCSLKIERGVMAKRVREIISKSNVDLCFQKAAILQQKVNESKSSAHLRFSRRTRFLKKDLKFEIESSESQQ